MKTHEGELIRALLGPRNKAAFAREAKIPGGPSMVSQHLSGNRPISLEAAIAYALGFGVSLEKVSPSAAAVLRQAVPLLRFDADPQVSTGATQAREPQPPWIGATSDCGLKRALPVVLDAIASARDRRALSVALTALVQDDSPLYRQRVAELLSPEDKDLAAA